MASLFPFAFVVYGASEMMLTTVVKVLIVETLRKQNHLTTMPMPNPNPASDISHNTGLSVGGESLNSFSAKTQSSPSLNDESVLLSPHSTVRLPQTPPAEKVFLTTMNSSMKAWVSATPTEESLLSTMESSTKAWEYGKTSRSSSLNDKNVLPSPHSTTRMLPTPPTEAVLSITKSSIQALASPTQEDKRSASVENEFPLPSARTIRQSPDLTKKSLKRTPVNVTEAPDASQIIPGRSLQSTSISLPHIENKDARLCNISEGPKSSSALGVTVASNNGKSGEDDLEKKVSWYLLLDQVCTHLPWIVIGPFCGAWSDRHGRKVLLLLPGMFHVLAVLVYLLVALWPGQLLALILLAGLLRGGCGKHAMFCTVSYGAMTDVVAQEERSARFASLMGYGYVGVCSGTLGAGLLLEYFSLSCPLLVVSSLQSLCFFLVLVAVKETVRLPPSNLDNTSSSVLSTIRNLVSRRRSSEEESLTKETCEEEEEEEEEYSSSEKDTAEQGARLSSLCRIIVILSLSFSSQSLMYSQREITVQTVSLPPFVWPKSWYGYLYAVVYGTGSIATLFLVPLVSRLAPRDSLSDLCVLVMALLCNACGCLWSALAVRFQSDWQVLASSSLAAVGMSANSICRALLSKEVSPSGQATAQAALYVLENLAKILGPLVHTAIFVATFAFSPWLVYLLMAGEAVLMHGLLCGLRTRRQEDYIVL